jgi:hypothetical protein
MALNKRLFNFPYLCFLSKVRVIKQVCMQIKFIYDKELTFYGEQLRALLYFTGVGDAGEIYVLCPKALHASLPQS